MISYGDLEIACSKVREQFGLDVTISRDAPKTDVEAFGEENPDTDYRVTITTNDDAIWSFGSIPMMFAYVNGFRAGYGAGEVKGWKRIVPPPRP